MKALELAKRFRVDKPDRFRLSKVDPEATGGVDIDKAGAKAAVATCTQRLAELQQKLYAEDAWAVLVILQGVDAAGKDSTIRHVMSGLNPLGCQAHSFKAPGPDELDHDYLWRAVARLPRRGSIGIFNRSYYEEVLVVRARPELLHSQRLPKQLLTDAIWKQRYDDINAFERYLARNGTILLKFHLHISQEEQARRMLERLEDPAKRWKLSMADLSDRKLWARFMQAYEDMIRHTSTREAPWHVVPADHKWFAHLVVASALVETLAGLHLKFPELDEATAGQLDAVRKGLAEAASAKPRRKR